MMTGRSWEIVGAPFGRGTSHPGTERAPAAVRAAGLSRRLAYYESIGLDVVDAGDVEPGDVERGDVDDAATSGGAGSGGVGSDGVGSDDAHTGDPARPGDPPTGTAAMLSYAPALGGRLARILGASRVPLVLGGDHSISIPTVTALAHRVRGGDSPGDIGLLWVDAHPDLELPGPESTGDLNAMAASHLLDLGVPALRSLGGFAPKVKPENLFFLGLRDVVAEEREILRDLGIVAFTMSDLERRGIGEVCDEIFGHLRRRTRAFAVSFDVDALDPSVAPAVDYPQPGGLTLREAMIVIEAAHASENLALLEFVELNPSRDRDDATSQHVVRLIHRALCGPVL